MYFSYCTVYTVPFLLYFPNCKHFLPPNALFSCSEAGQSRLHKVRELRLLITNSDTNTNWNPDTLSLTWSNWWDWVWWWYWPYDCYAEIRCEGYVSWSQTQIKYKYQSWYFIINLMKLMRVNLVVWPWPYDCNAEMSRSWKKSADHSEYVPSPIYSCNEFKCNLAHS